MYNLSGIRIDGQLCRTRYFFHKPTEESDTEEESADEGNGSDHIKEDPVDDEVPLFIPPDSPPPNLDRVDPIDLNSLPHSDWIKLEPTEASLPPGPGDQEALPADDGYETDKGDSVEEDGGWVDLFEAQSKTISSQSTLKSEEVHSHLFIFDHVTNDSSSSQAGWARVIIMTRMRYSSTCKLFPPSTQIAHTHVYRVFYLDSPNNARANNMKVWTGHEKAITIRYALYCRPLILSLTLFNVVKF